MQLNNFAQTWQGRFFEFGIFRCGRAIRFENLNIYILQRLDLYSLGYYSCLDNSGTRVQMHTFEISAIKLYRADCFERRAILLQDINRNCQIYCDQIVFQLLQYRLNIDSWAVQFQEELIYTLYNFILVFLLLFFSFIEIQKNFILKGWNMSRIKLYSIRDRTKFYNFYI